MRNSTLYRIIRFVGRPFRYRVIGLQSVHETGPAIFVANHLGSVGPLASILSVPIRFYPWVIAEMTDYRRAPGYLFDDFVRPTWRLNGRTGMAVSWLISRVSVTLLRGLGSISVERYQGEAFAAFRQSLDLLAEGCSLLVFPEDATQPPESDIHLHPFMCGFVGLCAMYERSQGGPLPVHPMAVCPECGTIAIGTALYFENRGDRHTDVDQMCAKLRDRVAELYRDLRACA